MKVGDLVSVIEDSRFDDSGMIGLVKWIDKVHPPSCGIIMNGKLEVYDPRHLEVVSTDLCKSEAGVI